MGKEAKTNAMRILDRAKAAYEVYTYEPGDKVDGITVANKMGQPLERVYKTLVTRGKSGGYFVFVIPVAAGLDLKRAAKAVGEKSVQMIHVKEINQITGYIRGGCSPIGMKKQFPTVVSRSAEALPTIIVSGGRIGTQIEINPQTMVKLIRGTFAEIESDEPTADAY
jgi:Cys-tRNA(Pro)/Cys-tRNA(Cys) deacylase